MIQLSLFISLFIFLFNVCPYGTKTDLVSIYLFHQE